MVDDCRMSHRETVDCQAEQIRRGERLVGAHMAARFALEVSAEQQNHSSIDRAGGTEPAGEADRERGAGLPACAPHPINVAEISKAVVKDRDCISRSTPASCVGVPKASGCLL